MVVVIVLAVHSSTVEQEDGVHRQVAVVARVARSHHVLGVKHLLCELGNAQNTVLLRDVRGAEEEVKAWERNRVHGQLAWIGVQLSRKAQAGGDARHGG